jgi:hypothetical protein
MGHASETPHRIDCYELAPHPECGHADCVSRRAMVALTHIEADVKAAREPDRSEESRLRALLVSAGIERDAAITERDKLQAFKDWVHAYLDGVGVPHHPPGTHGAAGCRIGDRMDWLMADHNRLLTALKKASEELNEHTMDYQHRTRDSVVRLVDAAIDGR